MSLEETNTYLISKLIKKYYFENINFNIKIPEDYYYRNL